MRFGVVLFSLLVLVLLSSCATAPHLEPLLAPFSVRRRTVVSSLTVSEAAGSLIAPVVGAPKQRKADAEQPDKAASGFVGPVYVAPRQKKRDVEQPARTVKGSASQKPPEKRSTRVKLDKWTFNLNGGLWVNSYQGRFSCATATSAQPATRIDFRDTLGHTGANCVPCLDFSGSCRISPKDAKPEGLWWYQSWNLGLSLSFWSQELVSSETVTSPVVFRLLSFSPGDTLESEFRFTHLSASLSGGPWITDDLDIRFVIDFNYNDYEEHMGNSATGAVGSTGHTSLKVCPGLLARFAVGERILYEAKASCYPAAPSDATGGGLFEASIQVSILFSRNFRACFGYRHFAFSARDKDGFESSSGHFVVDEINKLRFAVDGVYAGIVLEF